MKRKTTKILSLILVTVLVAMTFSSCSYFSKAPQYKENADGMALYRYKSSSTETVFTVPDTYENKPVTELMDFSISNAEYIETINIGENITTIGSWALTNCPMLKAINVDKDNPNYTSIDGVLYNKDMTVLLAYPNSKSVIERDKDGNYVKGGDFVVPNSVETINDHAFYLCSNLYSIKFNEGLKKIGDETFIKCENLAELNLPSTVTEIGVDAFSYCNSLKIVEIPSSVKKIGNYAFFSTASNIEKIIVHQDSEKDIELGEKWLPNIKDNVQKTVPVEYVGAKQ